MKINKLAFIIVLFLFFGCNNKPNKQNSDIKSEIERLESVEDKKRYLEKILEDDQKVRGSKSQELMLQYGKDSKEHMDYIKAQWKQDEVNIQKVEAYFEKYGYPEKKIMGRDAALAPWSVIHHSTDIGIRNRNFGFLYDAYLNGDVDDTAMSMYLGRTYNFTYGESFNIESPFKPEDEINQLIEKLKLK